MKKLFMLAMVALMVTSCDAQRERWANTVTDTAAKIECYSGGLMIYSGKSTGKIISEANSDGYYFRDSKDGKLKEVSGNCVLTYD